MYDDLIELKGDKILDHIYTDMIYGKEFKAGNEVISKLPVLIDNHLATYVYGYASIYSGWVNVDFHVACKFICKYNKKNKKYITNGSNDDYGYNDNDKKFITDSDVSLKLKKYTLPVGIYAAEFENSNFAVLNIRKSDDTKYGGNNIWSLYFIGKKYEDVRNKYFKMRDKYSDINMDSLSEQIVYTDSSESPKDVIFKSFDQMVIRDKDKYLAVIDNWVKNIPLFYERGIPCKLSVLLYGKPGTGKSTFCKALAKRLGIKRVCSVSPWYFSSGDRRSITSSRYSEPQVLSIDDIDCIVPNRESSDNKNTSNKASLASVLEFLDNPPNCYYKANNGIYYPISIIVATTNYYDKIDPAVKRYGRFDLQIEMNEFNLSEAEEMCNIYNLSLSDVLGESEINNKLSISPAYLQSLCIEKIDKSIKFSN